MNASEKKLSNYLIFLLHTLFGASAFAQQDPQFSQNLFLKLPVNSAYAGMIGSFSAITAYRNQWVGFPGNPKTFVFCADAPVKKLNGGVGFIMMNDKIGNFIFNYARIAYSYHIPTVGRTGVLGIGIEAGVVNANYSADTLHPSFSGTTYDMGIGSYYRTTQLYVGLSISHLPGKLENFSGINYNYTMARHYYLMAGYDFLRSSKINIRPNVLVKSDAAVTTCDLNLIFIWENFVWFGTSYRFQDAIATMAGITLRANSRSLFKVGYAYDIGFSSLRKYHNNTHEFLLSYSIKLKGK